MKARTSSGFSLLELMITIIIAAVLAAFALPSFRTYFIRSNISSSANGLLAAMNAARAEAVKRNAYVRVDPSICGTGTPDWGNGAFVWLPGAGNPTDTAPTVSTDARILTGEVVTGGSACDKKLTVSTISGAGNVVCFNGSGRMNLNVVASACASAATSAPLQVRLCDIQNVVKNGAVLDVSQGGRALIQPNVTCP